MGFRPAFQPAALVSSTKSPSEFVSLWTLHARRVYAYIFSLVPNAPDADDLLQETSLVLLQKFEEAGPIGNFPAWACRVAQLKVLEFYRQRRPAELLDELFLDAVHQEASKHFDGLDRRMEALSDCLAKLPSKDRRLIDLRYGDNSSVEAVARKVGRTASAVYKALARVRESLLDCVRHKLKESEPA